MKASEIKILNEEDLFPQVTLTYEVMQLMVKYAAEKSFGIMSWEIEGASLKQNNTRFVKLIEALDAANLGYWIVNGVGQEKLDDGKIQLVKEQSIIIRGPTLEQMKTLCSGLIAKQSYFIYAGPDNEGKLQLFESSGAPYKTWKRMVRGLGSFGYTMLPDGSKFRFA